MLKKTIIILAVLFLSGTTKIAIADAPLRQLKDYTVPELVQHFASQYNVSAEKMLATMKCESSLNIYAEGDNHTSFGISQIHLPAHPEVTKEQAFNPVFASEFMAKEFARGHQRIWSCYRILYK